MNLQRNIVMLLLPCSSVGRPRDRAGAGLRRCLPPITLRIPGGLEVPRQLPGNSAGVDDRERRSCRRFHAGSGRQLSPASVVHSESGWPGRSGPSPYPAKTDPDGSPRRGACQCSQRRHATRLTVGPRACRADDSALAESRVRCVYNPGKDRGLALRFGRN